MNPIAAAAGFFFWVLLVLANLSTAQEKPDSSPKNLTIATVNLNQIFTRVGYQEMAVLRAPPELKQRLREIAKEEAAAQKKILEVKDEGDMQKLQVELRVLGEKKRLFMQAFQALGRDTDQQRELKNFIQSKFGKKYPVILNGEAGSSFMNSYNVVFFRADTKDITDEVVAALQGEISGDPNPTEKSTAAE